MSPCFKEQLPVEGQGRPSARQRHHAQGHSDQRSDRIMTYLCAYLLPFLALIISLLQTTKS